MAENTDNKIDINLSLLAGQSGAEFKSFTDSLAKATAGLSATADSLKSIAEEYKGLSASAAIARDSTADSLKAIADEYKKMRDNASQAQQQTSAASTAPTIEGGPPDSISSSAREIAEQSAESAAKFNLSKPQMAIGTAAVALSQVASSNPVGAFHTIQAHRRASQVTAVQQQQQMAAGTGYEGMDLGLEDGDFAPVSSFAPPIPPKPRIRDILKQTGDVFNSYKSQMALRPPPVPTPVPAAVDEQLQMQFPEEGEQLQMQFPDEPTLAQPPPPPNQGGGGGGGPPSGGGGGGGGSNPNNTNANNWLPSVLGLGVQAHLQSSFSRRLLEKEAGAEKTSAAYSGVSTERWSPLGLPVSVPFTSKADEAAVRTMVKTFYEGKRTPNISSKELTGIYQNLSAQGYTRDSFGTGKDSTNSKNTDKLARAFTDITQTNSALGTDPEIQNEVIRAVRYGNEPIDKMVRIIKEMGSASQAAGINLQEFKKQTIALSEDLKGLGSMSGKSLGTGNEYSASSGMAPSSLGAILSNPLFVAKAMQMAPGTQPNQIGSLSGSVLAQAQSELVHDTMDNVLGGVKANSQLIRDSSGKMVKVPVQTNKQARAAMAAGLGVASNANEALEIYDKYEATKRAGATVTAAAGYTQNVIAAGSNKKLLRALEGSGTESGRYQIGLEDVYDNAKFTAKERKGIESAARKNAAKEATKGGRVTTSADLARAREKEIQNLFERKFKGDKKVKKEENLVTVSLTKEAAMLFNVKSSGKSWGKKVDIIKNMQEGRLPNEDFGKPGPLSFLNESP